MSIGSGLASHDAETSKKDCEALPTRQYAYQLVVRGHRGDARCHRQVERWWRVVIVTFMCRGCTREKELCGREDHDSQSKMSGVAPKMAQTPDGLRPISVGHRLSRPVSQNLATRLGCSRSTNGQSRDRTIGGRRRSSGGAPCIRCAARGVKASLTRYAMVPEFKSGMATLGQETS
jgi:hypothetical protein